MKQENQPILHFSKHHFVCPLVPLQLSHQMDWSLSIQCDYQQVVTDDDMDLIATGTHYIDIIFFWKSIKRIQFHINQELISTNVIFEC